MNWRAKPLVSYQVIVDLISAMITENGLTVHCELDQGSYLIHPLISNATESP